MKTIKLNKLVTLIACVLALYGCVQDDDFKAPDSVVVDPSIPGNIIDIDAVLGTFNQSGEDIITFEGTNNYMLGYVISSDEGGNFFEELVLQDKPENPTAGINIQVDVSPLFTIYNFGRKVYVKLDGLSAGVSNGVITLGKRDGNRIAKISAPLMTEHLIRTSEVATIIPLEISITDFSNDLENLYIRLNNVQFNRFDVLGDNPKTFAAEDDDQFDGERLLESCEGSASVILSTSSFSDFKSLLLPVNRGSIDGVLTRDFFDDFYTIYINTPDAINFNNTERCDPVFLECTDSGNGTTIFYEDNFESYANIDALTTAGWTNVNVSGGNVKYTLGSFSGSKYAQITGFPSAEVDIQAWLVTPSINMDATTAENLTFDVQANFDNGRILSVLVSSNFTGDVTTADWQILDVNIPTGPSGGFGTFAPAGPVNMSCIDGNINIAFFYQGSDPGATTRYHIDNIKMRGTN